MSKYYNYEKQHKKGKLHAIERIRALLDEGTFVEIGSKASHARVAFGIDQEVTPYDGVITGFGEINGRKVGIYSQDFTILGGSLGKQHGAKIANIIRMCIDARCPVIGINDSGGARIQEGVHSLAGYGDIFYYNTLASGYIPQISIIAGPCAGGAVYSPGLTDFVYVIDGISNMFVTGPKVVKEVTNEVVSTDQLGGASIHSTVSGVAHFRCHTEIETYNHIRKLLDLVPHYYGDNRDKADHYFDLGNKKKMIELLPEKRNRTYDMKNIIRALLDKDSFIEIHEQFARNAIVGLGKLSGIRVGIVANQPHHMAGVIDFDASDKIARFVRYCDAFEIPIITFTDVPGFMPGIEQETRGIIRHGAKVLYAYSEATVPKINVIIRKAYGGAYIAMCSKHLGADFVYAWPTAEIAVMGAEAAIDVIRHKEINAADDPERFKKEKVESYNKMFLNPNIAAEWGYIDEVIDPDDTRKILFQSLSLLAHKKPTKWIRKKHGNIPL
jgi:acetyl-CoA carboxylase carboxyltransferase component